VWNIVICSPNCTPNYSRNFYVCDAVCGEPLDTAHVAIELVSFTYIDALIIYNCLSQTVRIYVMQKCDLHDITDLCPQKAQLCWSQQFCIPVNDLGPNWPKAVVNQSWTKCSGIDLETFQYSGRSQPSLRGRCVLCDCAMCWTIKCQLLSCEAGCVERLGSWLTVWEELAPSVVYTAAAAAPAQRPVSSPTYRV